MVSLSADQPHAHRYWVSVESIRHESKLRLHRGVGQLDRVDDILCWSWEQRSEIQVASVSAGEVSALLGQAPELDIARKIKRAREEPGSRVQQGDGHCVAESWLSGRIFPTATAGMGPPAHDSSSGQPE